MGTTFTLPSTLGTIAFDFNPAADRIRLVDTATRANYRLNPNAGATASPFVATDGVLTYANGDTNAGSSPSVTGVAYTNNDIDGNTPTVIYGIDSAKGTLVSVGDSVNGTTVSPNTGQLFTIANLSTAPGSGDVGFDITPNTGGVEGNRALVAFASTAGSTPRLYELNLTTGQLSGGAAINVPVSTGVIDIAVGGTGTIATPAAN